MSDEMGALRRNFMPEDLRPLQQHRLDGCVAVQARTLKHETDFLLDLSEHNPWIVAVIGWADLSATDLEEQLQRWSQRASLAGLRQGLQNNPLATHMVASESFRRGLTALQSRQLVFELLVSHDQLPLVEPLCRDHDRHWLVLDHLGKPDIRGRQIAAWRRELEPLARHSHVICKLSGFLTEANNAANEVDEAHVREYLDTALELFGPTRVMFGSDWPVCSLVAPYARAVDIVDQWSEQLEPHERAALWGGTAARVYGLDVA